ncbi:hypothetical protein WR25_00579 [Diploscapter pachys]|uniref:SXP/RAL-2 family protein Ani s 5-like cation-binding domain-containing protein n=1 Tax=Diploscapter pachys TaxID=2018661 RepID=A0A2A2JKC8_9BILA|nr:hypothetical protein WR25_00579 [Diploscapter pachys]
MAQTILLILSAIVAVCWSLHGDVYIVENRIVPFDEYHDQQLNSFIRNSSISKSEKIEKLAEILSKAVKSLDVNRIREFEYDKIVKLATWLRFRMTKNGEFSRSLFSTAVDTTLTAKPELDDNLRQETMYIARFMLPRRELKRMMKIEQEAKSRVSAEILLLKNQALSSIINVD